MTSFVTSFSWVNLRISQMSCMVALKRCNMLEDWVVIFFWDHRLYVHVVWVWKKRSSHVLGYRASRTAFIKSKAVIFPIQAIHPEDFSFLRLFVIHDTILIQYYVNCFVVSPSLWASHFDFLIEKWPIDLAINTNLSKDLNLLQQKPYSQHWHVTCIVVDTYFVYCRLWSKLSQIILITLKRSFHMTSQNLN